MDISLFSFVFVFIALTCFFVVRRKLRPLFLLMASYYFCYYYSKEAAIYLFVLSIFTYILAIVMQKVVQNKYSIVKKGIFIIFIGIVVFQLIFFKEFKNTFVPLGISFYSFQMISYLVDIYSEKTKAEKNIINVLLSFVWFPKLISGPVEKTDGLINQIRNLEDIKLFKNDRFLNGLVYVVYGLFEKYVLADRMAQYVDILFANPSEYGNLWLIVGSISYTLQIYFDFAGYSYMAVGISKWFGIELIRNFNIPYFAENINDFWKRWHISLSSWLQQYIYIPLGGNRKGQKRQYVNILIVFIICGFWHGSGATFLIWGLLHGVYSVITHRLKGKKLSFGIKGISGRIITFCMVSFAWIFFRADSMSKVGAYISGIFLNWKSFGELYEQAQILGIDYMTIIILVVGFLLVLFIELNAYKKNQIPPDYLIETGEWHRGFVVYIMIIFIFVFGIYGVDVTNNFIYMQF